MLPTMFWKTEEVPKVYLTALCAWREARGCNEDAIIGVLQTIANRATHPTIHWWGKGFEEVVLKAKQFSSFNADDPNAVKFPSVDDPQFKQILSLTDRVIMKQIPDPTGGATHYHDKSAAPSWAEHMERCATIGPFTFYK